MSCIIYISTNLEKNRLEYFSSRTAAFDGVTKPSGSIQLENLKSVKKFDEFLFQLDAGVDGVYMLRADSYANLACWVNEFDRYIKARQVPWEKLLFKLVLWITMNFLYGIII